MRNLKNKQLLERGQSFVEMAFGMVVLIILLGGLFDVGRAFLILIAVENATGEGALYGASNPECLDPVISVTACPGTESVAGRVREEGKPMVTMTDTNSSVTVAVEGDGVITGGGILRVDVNYTYSPVTPVGFILWGDTAEVKATARQQIMSPVRPGS